MFINPITFSSFAIFFAWLLMLSWISLLRLYGGREQPESPECIPACSICWRIPPISIESPSETTSTSTSIASVRYRSKSTGLLFETSTASLRYESNSLTLWTSCIALPPSTYEGLTTNGKPITSDASNASSLFLTVAFFG